MPCQEVSSPFYDSENDMYQTKPHHYHALGKALAVGLSALLILASCSWYNDVVLDNNGHALPCDQLPTKQEVEQVLADHQDVVQRILTVNPDQVFIDVDSMTCPHQASLVISYPGHRDRVMIEEIIANDTFFGVPFRLQNH